jgi:hypothetical protein
MNRIRRTIARRWTPLSLLIGLAMLPSCEQQSGGVIDPPLSRPFLLSGTVTPDTVRTSALPQTGNTISGSLTVSATVLLATGGQALQSVNADLIDPVSNEPLSSTTLARDTGLPDTSGDTLHFAGSLNISLPKSTSGRFRVRFSLTTASSSGSNIIERSAFFLRDNHPPAIVNLILPDTVQVPAGGSTNFAARAQVSDPDGQTDISQVFFTNLDSSDPTHRYTLLDDGSDNSSSGDAVAGDGIYTITVTAPASAKGKIYRFLFQATDAFGDTSASILHFLTIM